jgi:hypothetical protein
MAQKGGKFKKLLLAAILIGLLVLVFVLAGGGDLLKHAGKQIEGAGKQADQLKQKVEEKATSVGKSVEKGIDSMKTGEKK